MPVSKEALYGAKTRNAMPEPITKDQLGPHEELKIGDFVRHGDLFVTDEGVYQGLSMQGAVYGVRVVGRRIARDNNWVRPIREGEQ